MLPALTVDAVIFGDEPTGALDSRTAGQTIVMVTHDPIAASFADRVVFLADGQLATELRNPTAEAVAERMTHLSELVHANAAAGTA